MPRYVSSARRLATPAAIFVASRIVAMMSAYLATRLPPGRSLLEVLGAWDGGYYLSIADSGYPAEFDPTVPSVHAFFPLYPMAIRAVVAITPLSGLQSAVLLNLVFGVAMAAVMWVLVERLADGDAATRAVSLVCFFPWAFVFSMAYAEALLLLLAAGCLLALLHERWLVAGVLAALAGAARPNGAALGFCCAWAALVAIRRRREWKALAAPALAPLGIFAFFAFLGSRTGDFFTNIRIKDEAFGDQGIGLSPAGMWPRFEGFFREPLNDLNMFGTMLSIVLIVAGVAAMIRWRPPLVLAFWAAPVLALAVIFTTYGSMPRFVLTAFPLLVALGVQVKGAWFHALLGAFATLMGSVVLVTGSTIVLTP